MGTCSGKYYYLTFFGPPGVQYADTLLKQLVSEVTIFLSAAIGMLLMLKKQGILMRVRTSEALPKESPYIHG